MRWLLMAAFLCSVGCRGQSPTAPNTPSLTPASSFSLSGYVFDNTYRRVSGAKVEVLDGGNTGLFATTDDLGAFSMPGKFSTGFNVRVTKDGYVPYTIAVVAAYPAVSLGVVLHSLAAPTDMTGTYTLAIVADSACASQLPEGLRARTYRAMLSPSTLPGSLPGDFSGTVSGGSFLPGHNAVWVGVAGDYMRFSIVDDDNADGIVERVDPSSFLNLVGDASATVGSTGVATISAPFNGRFEYCATSGTSSDVASFYACSTSNPVARCSSNNHRLILTRQ